MVAPRQIRKTTKMPPSVFDINNMYIPLNYTALLALSPKYYALTVIYISRIHQKTKIKKKNKIVLPRRLTDLEGLIFPTQNLKESRDFPRQYKGLYIEPSEKIISA